MGGVNWRQVIAMALATVATSALLFVGYRAYQDHVLLANVVTYLNAQAAKSAPVEATPVPEVKK